MKRLGLTAIVFALLFLAVLPTHCSPLPVEDVDALRLVRLKDEVIASCYPELTDYDIRLTPFEDEGFFFETSVRKPLARRASRIYIIKFNREIFLRNLPERPLAAIMTHEIGHISDYVHMSAGDFIELGLVYLFSKKFRDNYERQTDLKVLERGLGPWLVEYRQWLYEQLAPKKVARRKETYMTPDEITHWIAQNPRSPCLSSP